MGALRRIWHRPRRRRRVVAAAGLVVAVVGGVVACDPGGLGSATVAFTTDQTATKELERRDVDVQWLTCTASVDGNKASGAGSSPSPSASAVASVDCRGETRDGKDITVTGKVTRAVDGRCVRGDLTAKVDGKQWFRVSGLGNCDAPSTPTRTPPATWQPPDNGRPAPTVTVTVTRTIWCRQDPNCLPVEGK